MVVGFKRLAVLAAVGMAVGVSVPASATVILDFEPGTFTGGGDTDGDVLTQGFRLADSNSVASRPPDAMVESVNGDGRVRSRDFFGVLTLTTIDGSEFDLFSFVLVNFTFNQSHRHGMQVKYNFFDGSSELSPVWVVGVDIPANRNLDGTQFVVNKTGLTSVEFINVAGDDTQPRLVYIDDINVLINPIPEPAGLTMLLPAAVLLRRRGR